ncbi:MAG: ABC-type transport auxiliary lipoprotein family protein [Sulfurimonas sp.]|jgi:cholesterol transport system auxiliary component
MKLFIIAIAILLFSGCSTMHPSKSEYRLNSNMPTKILSQAGCANKSLKVAEAFSSSTLMALDMNYVQGINKQFAYSQAQWSISPNHAITDKLLELIRDANLFKSVQVSKSRSKNDLILETNIEDFMQYYSEDFRESYSNVVITLTLIDATTNSVVSTKTFSSKVAAKSLDSEGGVIALDSALYDVLSQINEWFSKVCK